MLESAMRFLALLLALPCIAFAQDPLGTLLGAGVRARPDYDGASKQELQPIPIIRYYGRTLFARTTQGILEGGARLEPLPKLWVGAQLAFEEGNDRTDLDPGGSWGFHVEWDMRIGPAPVSLLARTRTHFDTERGSPFLRSSISSRHRPSTATSDRLGSSGPCVPLRTGRSSRTRERLTSLATRRPSVSTSNSVASDRLSSARERLSAPIARA